MIEDKINMSVDDIRELGRRNVANMRDPINWPAACARRQQRITAQQAARRAAFRASRNNEWRADALN